MKYKVNIVKSAEDDLFELYKYIYFNDCEDNADAVERVDENPRLTHIVSRGGSILYEWIKETGNENPFYEHYDRLLEICKKYYKKD